MIYLPIVIGAIFSLSAESFKIHGHDKRPEVLTCTYPTSNQPIVSDKKHDIVPVTEKVFNEDSSYKEISFHVKDESIKVNLQRSDGVLVHKNTRVWLVKKENNKVQFKLQENALNNIEAYVDESTHSSFVKLPEENGYYFYYGVYDYSIGVKAAPKQHARRRREVEENKTVSTIDHIVYTLPKQVNFDLRNAYTSFEPDLCNKTSELAPPETVYPEILVIMDYALYSHYKGNLQEALSYIITFWNAVDLKFRDLREPAVKLNIAGIIIEEEEAALLHHSVIQQNGTFKGKVNRNFVLDDIGTNLYNSHLKIREDYDLAVYMMGNDLVTSNFEEELEKRHGLDGILGVAKLGMSCIKDDSEGIVDAVSAFEDSNGYIGILHGIHELGHLFGASHDGERGNIALGLPGAENCKTTAEDDFIMSTKRIDGKKFSYCSKEAMRIFFHKESAECLRNPPVVSSQPISSIILPGKKLSLDEQCESAGFLRAHFNDTSVCDHLYCIAKTTNDGVEYVTSLPGAEGSICDIGYHCINGNCIKNDNTDEYLTYRYVDKRTYIGK
ncbi:venom metalloproteinase 2-like [Leptopilina boulardi]|uniref:venom metalloproteinase 2-like n=1 Tax=Leptopilina boulardi TaxID=63433 RepID=UPI0021F612D9|nr:venom metalloproteinase 2-like [Leptopilina boulardi]